MEKDQTTIWERVKDRRNELVKHGFLMGDGAELGKAICEELERIHKRIDDLEKKVHLHNEVR